MCETGAGLCSGNRASTVTSARRGSWRSRTSWALCSARLSAREGLLAGTHLPVAVVDDLLEARHVRALLIGPQLDHALKARGEQLLGAGRAQADHLLDR